MSLEKMREFDNEQKTEYKAEYDSEDESHSHSEYEPTSEWHAVYLLIWKRTHCSYIHSLS